MLPSITDTARLPNDEATYRISIPSNPSRIPQVVTGVLERMRIRGCGHEVQLEVAVALKEALVNAIVHGNKNDSTKRVWVRYRVTDTDIFVAVADEGWGFRPKDASGRLTEGNGEKPPASGIAMMRACMDGVNFGIHKSEVRMIRLYSGEPRSVAAERAERCACAPEATVHGAQTRQVVRSGGDMDAAGTRRKETPLAGLGVLPRTGRDDRYADRPAARWRNW